MASRKKQAGGAVKTALAMVFIAAALVFGLWFANKYKGQAKGITMPPNKPTATVQR